ncbi:dicarboxylate/amino acid:cation symporter [Paraferrimonas sedimenticola]|uniref:Proton/sodium:glutamate symporter DAACS family protein n=1 Tax=Paraferrimonas sedimenticola TaxID=375674 RepID=A0AA37RTR4_9GAMM|nr:dicarboxylate/amino acid:cation symporter [Paraferrimonas sedimenticola]GLP95540.1 proton/sodium:glutamate symporter DAACS family protein [Paraferrimonas sedimenticola]
MFRSLSSKIFGGLFIGLLFGTLIQYALVDIQFFSGTVVELASGAGTMFVSLIKLLVVPLVFFSIVNGICGLKDMNTFGRLGGKTFGFYIANTLIAISVALVIAMVLQPGRGLDLTGMSSAEIAATELPNVIQLIVGIIPDNPIQAFAEGNMLQIIFMSLLTGGIIKSLGEAAAPAQRFFAQANAIMMKMITVVMQLAPIGVFALMVTLGATLEASSYLSVLGYIGLILSLLVLWIFVVYPSLVAWKTNVSAAEFRRKTREQFLFSLSTASSNATIPVTMRTLTEKLNVKPAVAGFGVPLGATMNMGGVSIYITIAAVFVGNAFGAPIGYEQLPALAFFVFLLSVGAGGVPGGGMVMIGVLIHQMGLPIEAFALVAALDRIIDMFVTSANVVGDSAVVTIVDRSEDDAVAAPAKAPELATANA